MFKKALSAIKCIFGHHEPEYKYKMPGLPSEEVYQCKRCGKYQTVNKHCNYSYWTKIKPVRLVFVPDSGIGDLSDGYHTFNELYHHRAVLFSVICNANKNRVWKSKSHSDGSMYDGMFIVGIETGLGQATYHYDVDPYWDLFDVKELRFAPVFDGHTPADAIKRIRSLSCEASVPEESSC